METPAPAPAPASTASLSKARHPSLVVILVASAVEFIAAARVCDKREDCDKEFGFAVAVGVIAVAVSALVVAIQYFMKELPSFLTTIIAIFFLALWGAGAGVNTFRNPFVGTGNGYFASWVAFGASSLYAYHNVGLVRMIVDKMKKEGSTSATVKVLWLVFVASIIEIAAAATLCDKLNECEKQVAWAVAVGAISIVLSTIALFVPLGPVKPIVAALLVAVWAFGAGVLTFDDPFLITGNGYFASWAAFFGSVIYGYLTLSEKFPALKRAPNQ